MSILFDHPPAQRGASSNTWHIVGLLWVAFLLNYINRQLAYSIFPALRSDLGFTNTQLALVGTLFVWIYSISSLVLGRLADVIRKQVLIVACLLLWSTATLGSGLSTSPEAFLFWRGMMGVTEALYLPAAIALIAALHPGETRSRALALHQTAQMTGIIMGGWGGGWMADHVGWRSAFQWLAIAGIAYAPVLWMALRGISTTPSSKRATSQSSLPLNSACYWALCLAFAAYCILLWMLYAWFPLHLYEKFRLSQAESGLAATLYLQVSTAVGVLVWGAIADQSVRRWPAARFGVVGFGILLCAPFAYAVLALDSLTWVKAASIGFGLFAGGLHSNLASAAYDVIPQHDHGFAVGVLNLIGGASAGVAVLLGGLWRDTVPLSTLSGWGAMISVAGSLILLRVVSVSFPTESVATRKTLVERR